MVKPSHSDPTIIYQLCLKEYTYTYRIYTILKYSA